MKINIRRLGPDYFEVDVTDGNASINLGLLDKCERTDLAIILIDSARQLTPTPCDKLTAEVEALASQCEVVVVPASHPTIDDLADALRELHDYSSRLTNFLVHAERSEKAFKRASELLERMGK